MRRCVQTLDWYCTFHWKIINLVSDHNLVFKISGGNLNAFFVTIRRSIVKGQIWPTMVSVTMFQNSYVIWWHGGSAFSVWVKSDCLLGGCTSSYLQNIQSKQHNPQVYFIPTVDPLASACHGKSSIINFKIILYH